MVQPILPVVPYLLENFHLYLQNAPYLKNFNHEIFNCSFETPFFISPTHFRLKAKLSFFLLPKIND